MVRKSSDQVGRCKEVYFYGWSLNFVGFFFNSCCFYEVQVGRPSKS